MNKYEGIFIIRPELDDENLKKVVGLIEDEIKKNKGDIAEIKSWGRRRLAYSIKRSEEGLYYQVDFGTEPAILKDIEKRFRLNDNILRFMFVKKEG